jgi:hypothetical protein
MAVIPLSRAHGVRRRTGLAFALGLLALTAIARAQENPLKLEPPLSQAFPLAATPTGIRVSCPVLVNDHTILRPDARLRFVYIDNNPTPHAGGDTDRWKSLEGPHGTLTTDPNTGGNTHGEQNTAVSPWGDGANDDHSGLFDPKKDDPKRNKQELQQEVWTERSFFDDAFDHAAETGTTLVYDSPEGKKPQSTVIDPPEGMLLGEIGGHIRVLAVDPESRPYAAGIRAGDEIRSIGDGPQLATLGDFLHAYLDARHQAKLSGGAGYTFNVWRDAVGEVIPVRVAPPPSIPSFL